MLNGGCKYRQAFVSPACFAPPAVQSVDIALSLNRVVIIEVSTKVKSNIDYHGSYNFLGVSKSFLFITELQRNGIIV